MTNTKGKVNTQTRENLNAAKFFVQTKQINKMAMMLVFAAVLMTGAVFGQEKGGDGFASVGIYTGMETMPGTFDFTNSMRYGNSFVLNSFGEWGNNHLSVSLNYSANSFVPNDHIVTGGSWSLVVIRENQYAGVLYGEVQTGSVNFVTDANGNQLSKEVYANLISTGGLGVFDGKRESIGGVYNMTTDLRSSNTIGNAYFDF